MTTVRGRAVALPAAALGPAAALAHGSELDWHIAASQSLVLLPLLAAIALYMAGVARRACAGGLARHEGWRAAAFASAVLLLLAALVWPLDAWSQRSFAAHMTQHMVLIALAPPLLLVGRPAAIWLRGLPAAWRTLATRPRRWPGAAALRALAASPTWTGVLQAAALWGWHLPLAFEMALRDELVHWLEHLTLLGSAMLFWRALLRARGQRLGWAVAAMLATVIHSGLLGALLTLAPRPLYTAYASYATPAQLLADQQLAGLIMWVPMGTVYLVAALVLVARGLKGGSAPAVASGPP